MSLFQLGNFTLHSGKESSYKIDCDVLTDEDIEALTHIALKFLWPFGSVEGVPRGGLRLAKSLRLHSTGGPLLVVDDVYTTGESMEKQRDKRDAQGLVIFARSVTPSWITPIFLITNLRAQY